MANKFIQSKLPYSNKDAEDAIKEMVKGLAKLDKQYGAIKTDARSIGQKMTVTRAGSYPSSQSSDPAADGALKKSVDVLEDHERLAADIPAKAAELEKLREKAEKRRELMDEVLAEASSNDMDFADEFPADLMMVMVQAVTNRRGSLDFLRGLSGEHRRLLLTKEQVLFEPRKAREASESRQQDRVALLGRHRDQAEE